MKIIIAKSKVNGDKEVFVSDEDYIELSKHNWYAHKDGKTFYANRVLPREKINGKKIQRQITMHRQILGLYESKCLVDHKDGNGLNNTRENLRIATHFQNSVNRRKNKGKLSQYYGVSQTTVKNRWKYWIASITKNGVVLRIGYFKDEVEAAKAYDTKAKELHGEFATINFK